MAITNIGHFGIESKKMGKVKLEVIFANSTQKVEI
jgi:hypothetical protein